MNKCTLHWIILSIMAIGYVACEAKINTDTIKDPLTVPSNDAEITEGQHKGKGHLTLPPIPETITSIGKDAFADNKLTSITIPLTITSIGKGAFTGNSELTTVILSRTLYGKLTGKLEGIFGTQVTTYQDHEGEPLTSPTIPPDTTTITEDTYKNKGYTSVFIPHTVKDIENEAFTGNPLESVSLQSKLYRDFVAWKKKLDTVFGKQVTRYFILSEDKKTIGTITVERSEGTVTRTFTVEYGITTIENHFLYDSNINVIIIPDYSAVMADKSVTSIGSGAFLNKNLHTVTLPHTLYRSIFFSGELNIVFGNKVTTYRFQKHILDNSRSKHLPPDNANPVTIGEITIDKREPINERGEGGSITKTTLTIPEIVTIEFISEHRIAIVGTEYIKKVILSKTLYKTLQSASGLEGIFGTQVTTYQDLKTREPLNTE